MLLNCLLIYLEVEKIKIHLHIIVFLIVNIQINHVLLSNNFCIETQKKMEDVLSNVWTNLAWWNVRLEELNLQTTAEFHRNLMSISKRANINLQISFSGNTPRNRVFVLLKIHELKRPHLFAIYLSSKT